MENTLIMGIESSCDETSVSILKEGKTILSNIISSQIEYARSFVCYGGFSLYSYSYAFGENLNYNLEDDKFHRIYPLFLKER